MVWALYYLVMAVATGVAWIAAAFNQKIRLFLTGRIGWKKKISALPPKSTKRIWIHVSSLGEFEQARPVMERLKQEQPSQEIILTFFSPSGYTIRSDYAFARVFYLPLDHPGNAKYWISKIQPDLAVFVKYDLWPGYLLALVQQHIPFILIAAHFQPGKLFSSWSSPLTAPLLKKSRMIFLQNGDHIDFVKSKGFHQIAVAGDTRVDRVSELPAEASARLPAFLKTTAPFDIVAGSTWPADEQLILPVLEKLALRLIIAPHDVSKYNIDRLCASLPADHIRLSNASGDLRARILVIDSIGLLSVLYACGRIAYIGGGFGKSIHNVLEPMAHGVPVVFGPAYHAFPEAVAMVKLKGAFTVTDQVQMEAVISRLLSGGNSNPGDINREYIAIHKGATEIITRYILDSILSPPHDHT
jgi:3-deoxy-D-manno-octulosonic-acid transferase